MSPAALLSPSAVHYGAKIAWKFHDADEWRIYFAALAGMQSSKAAKDVFDMIAAKAPGHGLKGPKEWGLGFAHNAIAHAMLIMAIEA